MLLFHKIEHAVFLQQDYYMKQGMLVRRRRIREQRKAEIAGYKEGGMSKYHFFFLVFCCYFLFIFV